MVDFYDYLATIRDLQGNIIMEDTVVNSLFKTEINVPNSTFLVMLRNHL